jgi:hypothetical protein
LRAKASWATDKTTRIGRHFEVKDLTEIRVVSVDRLRQGLVITFDDGVSALFTATFLHSALPHAQKFEEMESDFGQET